MHDSLDGAYTDKRRFYIFDYCGNFEFFRTKANGIEGKETQTLAEVIFAKQIRLILALQESIFGDENHFVWRNSLVQRVTEQINALNLELVAVSLQRKHVEKFKKETAFASLSERDKRDLIIA